MVVLCDIRLDKSSDLGLRAGQLVNGTVTLELDKPTDVKAVLLKLSGFAETSWTEGSFEKSESYSGHQDFLDSEINLLDSLDANKCTLPAGKHQYNFTFELPKECPTSFEGLNGRIWYASKVVLVRPWRLDKNFMKAFSVIKEFDLNARGKQIAQPLHASAKKILHSNLSTKEPLTLSVTLARSGFIPGDHIPIEVVITNDSSIAVKEIQFSLIRIVKCFERNFKFNSVTEEEVVSKLKGEGVLNHCKKLFNYELIVPATPPTCVDDCEIINLSYEVRVQVVFKGFHSSLVLHLPVIIGTEPITNNVQGKETVITKAEEAKEIATKNGTTEQEMLGGTPSSSSAFDMPPLSYEEAVRLPHADRNSAAKHDYDKAT